MYVLKECEPDDPDQIEVKTIKSEKTQAVVDKKRRKRKTSGYDNEWYQMKHRASRASSSETESDLSPCDNELPLKTHGKQKMTMSPIEVFRKFPQGKDIGFDSATEARQRSDHVEIRPKGRSTSYSEEEPEGWQRRKSRERQSSCYESDDEISGFDCGTRRGKAIRQISALPLLERLDGMHLHRLLHLAGV